MWKQDPQQQRLLELEQQQRDHAIATQKASKSNKKKWILGGSVVVIALFLVAAAFAFLSPGKYDSFAQCLKEKGAVMYGEDWCPYTQGQKKMFGNSFKYVDYHIKTDLHKRPTWAFEGKDYEGVQSFDTLASLTGCKYN